MKLLLLNTPTGLKPLYDADFDEKRKLRLGEVYTAEVKLARNIQFHRKYFALINTAWEYLNEATTAHFGGNVEAFRKCVEVAAGHCDRVYHLASKSWLEVPKSIAFDKMDEAAFGDLYERVKDVLFRVFLKDIDEKEFIRIVETF
jgi:hypothetical protein